MAVALVGTSHSPLMSANHPGDEVAAAVDEAFSTARAFIRSFAPDLLLLYFRGVDHAQHAYWFARAPEESATPVDEADRRHFGGLIDSYYVYMDEVVGRYRAAAPEGTPGLVGVPNVNAPDPA